MAKEVVFKANLGPAGKQLEVELVPVFQREVRGLIRKAWAAQDFGGEELGTLVTSYSEGRRFCNPVEGARPMFLAQWRLRRDNLYIAQSIALPESFITDVRPLREEDIPTSTCSQNTFNALRRKARQLQEQTDPGTIVPWPRLVAALKLDGKKLPSVGDVVCALRAEGWRPVGRQGWTYHRFLTPSRSRRLQ